ncbi:unnamed protein product [Caenorhabditis brenneri]
MSEASSVGDHSVATDNGKPLCKRLKVSCKDDCVICYYDNQCVRYVSPTWNEYDIYDDYINQRFADIIKRDDFEKVAFDALASLLKNPNLQLELFSFNFDDFDYTNKGIKFDDDKIWKFFDKLKKMQTILESIDHQLSVKACQIRIPNRCNAMSILPYLKPGVLEKITILSDAPGPGFDYGSNAMQQVASLDQWKQATELELRCGFTEYVMDYATHFKRFKFHETFDILGFRLKPSTIQFKLPSIRDFISENESAESCSILCNYGNMDEYRGIVGIKISPNSSHYSIPNSDDYLEFVFTKNHITIEKKKKQLMEQSNEDLSKAMEQLTVTADDSNEASKPPKNLSDMPLNVVGLIIERSDYKEQLTLQRTSRLLRELVEKEKPALTRLTVLCFHEYIIVNYNDHCVAYVQPSWHHSDFLKYTENHLDSIVSNVNYEQDAFNDLASICKNPNLQLELFSFDIRDTGFRTNGMDFQEYMDWKYESDYKRMQNMLESLNHQLPVKECRIDVSNYDNVMSILPYMKPGVLEKITLFMGEFQERWDEFSENLEQFSLLEQWNQAKELHFDTCIGTSFPTEYATHFKRFYLNYAITEWDEFIWFRDYLLEHESVEFCLITDDFQYEILHLKKLVRREGTRVSPNLYHYTVPDSKYYLEFKIEDKLVTIEKKKKKNQS